MPRKSIVTRGGDGGETGLLYGGRVRKTDSRTEAYGAVDEAISALGLARAQVRDRGRAAAILRLQEELFTVGAELATDPAEYETLRKHFLVITPAHTQRLEEEVLAVQVAAEDPCRQAAPAVAYDRYGLPRPRRKNLRDRDRRRVLGVAHRVAIAVRQHDRFSRRYGHFLTGLDAQTHAWAFQALGDITGQRLPQDSAAWRNWYEKNSGSNQ